MGCGALVDDMELLRCLVEVRFLFFFLIKKYLKGDILVVPNNMF